MPRSLLPEERNELDAETRRLLERRASSPRNSDPPHLLGHRSGTDVPNGNFCISRACRPPQVKPVVSSAVALLALVASAEASSANGDERSGVERVERVERSDEVKDDMCKRDKHTG